MSGSINKVILVGNLGADPEIRHTQAGRPVCNLRVATSERWRDKGSGEQRERTEWHRVVIFNEGLCGVVERFLHKGSKIYIEGQLQTRRWQDQSGQERFNTEVVLQGFNSTLVMLDGRGDGGGGDGGDHGGGHGGGGGGHRGGGGRGGGYGGKGGGGGHGGGKGGGGRGGGGHGGGGGQPPPADDPIDGDADDEIPF